MDETRRKLGLVKDASISLIEYIEDLLQDARIEIPKRHIPIRRALFWFAPTLTEGSSYIPFSVFKDAIDAVINDEGGLLDEAIPFTADPENEGFGSEVQKTIDWGMSEDEAIQGVSGSDGLESLGMGMAEGFVELIEDAVPGGLVGLEGLKQQSSPIRDYMEAGHPGPAGLVSDVAERIKNVAKVTLGLKAATRKETETAPQKIVNYVVSVAASRTHEFSPARIWHAWMLYPKLKGIHNTVVTLEKEDLSSTTRIININGQGPQDLNNSTLETATSYIRQSATMLSNTMGSSVICCMVGALVDLPDITKFTSNIKAMLDMAAQMNSAAIRLTSINYSNLGKQAYRAVATALINRINRKFQEHIQFLRDSFRTLKDKLGDVGDSAFIDCLPLDQLFNGVLNVLYDLKAQGNARLLDLINNLEADANAEFGMNLSIADNIAIANLRKLIEEIERIVRFADKCQISEEGLVRRAKDLSDRVKNKRRLPIHIEGEPLPEGVDTDHPLVNLKPIRTKHGFTLKPGIEGQDLPTDEFRELFKSCRKGGVEMLDNLQILQAAIKRK